MAGATEELRFVFNFKLEFILKVLILIHLNLKLKFLILKLTLDSLTGKL